LVFTLTVTPCALSHFATSLHSSNRDKGFAEAAKNHFVILLYIPLFQIGYYFVNGGLALKPQLIGTD
jgi:hypothetical protein